MNKRNIFISCIVFVTFILCACNKTKTYSDYLKDESKAIEKFIKAEGIKVLKKFPEDNKFKEKEFYFDPGTGVYYHIIDAGEGEPIKPGKEVYIRYKGLKYFMNDTTSYTNIYEHNAEALTFGNPNTYSVLGFVIPLEQQYVRNGGSVSLIVPFNAGTSYAKKQYQPAYYKKVTYRFEQY